MLSSIDDKSVSMATVVTRIKLFIMDITRCCIGRTRNFRVDRHERFFRSSAHGNCCLLFCKNLTRHREANIPWVNQLNKYKTYVEKVLLHNLDSRFIKIMLQLK